MTNAERQKRHREKLKRELHYYRSLANEKHLVLPDNKPQHIINLSYCTRCNGDLFFVSTDGIECINCHQVFSLPNSGT